MKRLCAMILALALVLECVPYPVFAEKTVENTETTEVVADTETAVTPTEEMVKEPTPVTVTGIYVAELPSRTIYQIGEVLDLTGGSIVVSKSDSTSEILDMSACNTSGFDSSTAGVYAVEIGYENATTSFEVTVIQPEQEITVTGIEVTTLPVKTQYAENEELDVTGGIIAVSCSDGTVQSVDLMAEMVTGFNNTVVGPQTLTVTYEGFEAFFDVTVTQTVPSETTEATSSITETTDAAVAAGSASENGVQWIELTTKPSKIQYIVNHDELDVSGGQITVHYTDGAEEIIDLSKDMITNFDNTNVGTLDLEIQFGGHSVYYRIAVVESEDQPLAVAWNIDMGDSKLLYFLNEPLELKDAVLTFEYSNGATEIIPITPEMVPGFDTSYTGTRSLWVHHGNTSYNALTYYTVVTADMLSGNCGDSAAWELSEDGILTISGSGSVTSRPWYEYRTAICSVVVEEGITELCNEAFAYCERLTDAVLPDTLVVIAPYTFLQCSVLREIVLSENLVKISGSAFSNCRNLESISFPDSLTTIEAYAFHNCTGLTEIRLPQYIASLGQEAFAGCSSVTTITFEGLKPPSVWKTFENINDITGYYPGTEQWKNSSFFDSCGGNIEWIATEVEETKPISWIELTTKPSKIQYVQNQDKLDVSGGVITVYYTDDTTDTVEVTSDMVSGFYNTVVGKRWLTVWYQGYSTSYQIAVVESADQPLIMRSEVDEGNSKQIYRLDESLQLDGAVLILEYSDGTVENIDITRQMLPDFDTSTTGYHWIEVQYKGELYSGFSYEVVEDSDLRGSCGEDANWEIYGDGRLCISGSGSVTSYPWSNYRSLIKSVEIYHGITELCDHAFAWCERLNEVNLPPTLEKIGYNAFYNCPKLTSISIPENVTCIEQSTFSECAGLTVVELPEGLAEIGYRAFAGCTNLNAITFPQNVTDIEQSAFEGCTGLTEIEFPKKLDYLGYRAFADCTNLNKITFESKESPNGGSETFEGVTATGYYPGTTYWNDDWFFENCGGEIEWIATGETVDSISFNKDYLECYVSGEGVGWTLSVTGVPSYLGIDCDFSADSDVIQLGKTNSTYCTFSTLKAGTATVTATDKRSGCTATATVVVKEPKVISCGYGENLVTDDGSIEAYYAFTPEESGAYILASTCNDRFVMEGPPFSVYTSDGWVAFEQWDYGCGDKATYHLEKGVTYYIEFYLTVGYGGPGIIIDLRTTFRLDKLKEITGIEIAEGYSVYGAVGEAFYYGAPKVKIMPENAMGEVTWESSNPAIISVRKEGVFTNMIVQGEGSAVLTAKCGDFTDSITVVTKKPEELLLNTPKMVSLTGQWYSFTPLETGRYAIISEATGEELLNIFVNGKYYPEDSNNTCSATKEVRFGTFTAGVTYYLCSYNEGTPIASPTTVTITKAEAKPAAMEVFCSYSFDNSMSFAVDFVPGNSYDNIVSWESSNPDILDCDSYYYGAIHSFNVYGSGEVTITAVSEKGLEARCTVTVGQCDNGHTFDQWRQTKAKTCTTDGQEMATCICGLRQYRTTPAGHDFVKGTCIRCGISGGTCGENMTWILDGEGVLTISGTGAMDQIGFDSVTGQHLPPWKDGQDRIKSVVIESGVTDVVDQAFGSCRNLETIVIPATVTKLGDFAILSCPSLQEIQVDAGNQHYCTVDGVLYSEDMTTLIKYPACRPGTEYTVPDTVTKLMHAAFDSTAKLVSITLPDNITVLDTDTFADCTSLKNIRLPKNLTNMEAGCIFWNCSSLESIEIPDNVQVIGSSVFAYCPNLKQVTLPASLKKLADYAFGRCENLETITIPAGVNCLENKIFEGSGLKEITFEGDAPKFDEDTFSAVTATAYYVASNPTWITDVMQDYGGNITWVPIQNRLNIDKTELGNHTTVWIDGVEYAVQTNGDQCYINILDDNARTMITYSYSIGNSTANQLRYPIGMQVWTLENENGIYTATRQEAFDDILQYSGMSIRVTGKKGIRMIMSIERSKKNALVADGLAGYTLKEYGTAVAWANQLSSTKPLTLGQSYVMSNYAYKKGVADPVFQYTDNQMQYTNVLVNFTDEQCKYDMALRPYMILEDSEGEALTIYGGIVYRSIGYIAYQNRNVFEPQSDEYNYIWDIIRYVYGDIDDDEFIHAWTPSIK